VSLRDCIMVAVSLAFERHFLWAVRWPVFSVTSFLMVSRLVREGVRPATVIDVGANIGQFGVACAKLFPNAVVHSFEPIPECFRRLQRVALRVPNLVPHNVALSDRSGEVDFHVNAHSQSSSVLCLNERHLSAFPKARAVRTIRVGASTLDEEFASQVLAEPILLKLDVQGYEANVLRGGRRLLRQVEFIVCETSFQPLYEGELPFLELAALIEDSGFRFLRPVGFLRDPRSGEYLQMDALFVRGR